MNLEILSGSANLPLTEKIAKNLGVQRSQVLLERFPDSELHFEIQESVRGHRLVSLASPQQSYGSTSSCF